MKYPVETVGTEARVHGTAAPRDDRRLKVVRPLQVADPRLNEGQPPGGDILQLVHVLEQVTDARQRWPSRAAPLQQPVGQSRRLAQISGVARLLDRHSLFLAIII